MVVIYYGLKTKTYIIPPLSGCQAGLGAGLVDNDHLTLERKYISLIAKLQDYSSGIFRDCNLKLPDFTYRWFN